MHKERKKNEQVKNAELNRRVVPASYTINHGRWNKDLNPLYIITQNMLPTLD